MILMAQRLLLDKIIQSLLLPFLPFFILIGHYLYLHLRLSIEVSLYILLILSFRYPNNVLYLLLL